MDPAVPFIAQEGESTFQYDDTLPSLPVPPLPQTLDKYLDSVKPHVTTSEYEETERIVKEFGNGVGKVLHEKLVARSKVERNWLEKWWEDHAYLESRYPISPFVNCGGPGPYIDYTLPPRSGTQLERGALILYYQLKYWQLLRSETLRVDRGSDKSVWAMNTFRRLFNCCRIPGETMDSLCEYFKTEKEGPSIRHAVIIHNGHMFYTDLVDDHDIPYSAPEIEEQLQQVVNATRDLPYGPALGCLTADDRGSWFKNRQHLLSLHPDNKKSLDILQRALLVVSLDDAQPVDRSQLFAQSMGGDPAGRWFDKSLNILFFKNGTVGMNIDHAPFDAMVLVSSSYYVDRHIVRWQGKWQGSTEKRPLPAPKQLVFHLDESLYNAINCSRTSFLKNADSMDYFAPMFCGYGKRLMRSLKLHPDTIVQLALQLGYYRLHNKPAPTYETATTRRFYHARTETVRSCTPEAVEWCTSMLTMTVSSQRRHELFKRAYKKHLKLMSDSSNAQGCDRHLFGLYLIAKKEGFPMPDIFTDTSFTKSGGGGNFVLSTSFVGYTTVLGGTGPMCKDGYGCFYQIRPEAILFFLSTWTGDQSTSSHQLFYNICKSLEDIYSLVKQNVPSKI